MDRAQKAKCKNTATPTAAARSSARGRTAETRVDQLTVTAHATRQARCAGHRRRRSPQAHARDTETCCSPDKTHSHTTYVPQSAIRSSDGGQTLQASRLCPPPRMEVRSAVLTHAPLHNIHTHTHTHTHTHIQHNRQRRRAPRRPSRGRGARTMPAILTGIAPPPRSTFWSAQPHAARTATQLHPCPCHTHTDAAARAMAPPSARLRCGRRPAADGPAGFGPWLRAHTTRARRSRTRARLLQVDMEEEANRQDHL